MTDTTYDSPAAAERDRRRDERKKTGQRVRAIEQELNELFNRYSSSGVTAAEHSTLGEALIKMQELAHSFLRSGN